MFFCEYCYWEMFKNTYFKKHLQTSASVHSVSELEKQSEKWKIHKSNGLVSVACFKTKSSPSEVLTKILVLLNIFANTKKMYIIVYSWPPPFNRLLSTCEWLPFCGNSDNKVCFSITMNGPPESHRTLFRKNELAKRHLLKKKIWLIK